MSSDIKKWIEGGVVLNENPPGAREHILMLEKAIRDSVYGTPLDQHGNRDVDGLRRGDVPDIERIRDLLMSTGVKQDA